jgi:hypothetical protein
MAINLAKVNASPSASVIGDRIAAHTDFSGDASYPTGGYALPASIGIPSPDWVDVQFIPVAAAGIAAFNYSTQKLQFFTTLTGTEVANTTNLTTVVGRLYIRGKGFASFATPNG